MYKLLAADLRHNGFQYQEGLNVDPVPFNPTGACEAGGLYYTDLEHIPRWYTHHWPLIADVTLPDDARVYAEPCGTKWKADRLMLSNIRPISEFLATFDEAALYHLLQKDCHMLKDMVNQTESLCMTAVYLCACTLQYVKNPTDKMRMAAVQLDGLSLQFVREQTDAICLAAVQRDGNALVYVDEQTEEICLAAVQQNGFALKYVREQTEMVCRAALARQPCAREYVKIPLDF
jgi:hypothetical protein